MSLKFNPLTGLFDFTGDGSEGVPIDTDPTLGANSDSVVPSQKAVKSYVDSKKVNSYFPGGW
jgi:hypothetical protein